MDRQPRPRADWEAIFHGSQREISTLIIGCEADFRKVKRMSPAEAAKPIRLKDYVNASYDSEATIAAGVGVSWDARSGWLRGKSKPAFKSLLKVQEFLKCQPKGRGGWHRLVMYR